MAPPSYHRVVADKCVHAVARDSLGGRPNLGESQTWPLCKLCGERMLFYLQFDLRPEFETPFISGSHFLVFACCQHDDIASLLPRSGIALPPEFWEQTGGHYELLFNRPHQAEVVLETDARIVPHKLSFSKQPERLRATPFGYDVGAEEAKIGGVPCWLQDPEEYRCYCGAPMRYFCQLPEYFEFPKAAGAPIQPNGVSGDSYILFLGNAVYFLACEKQCSPFAVIAVMQN
jgi:hypothetical protein